MIYEVYIKIGKHYDNDDKNFVINTKDIYQIIFLFIFVLHSKKEKKSINLNKIISARTIKIWAFPKYGNQLSKIQQLKYFDKTVLK